MGTISQGVVINWIQEYIETNHQSPTVNEITKAFGLDYRTMKRYLREMGFFNSIYYSPRTHRTIRIRETKDIPYVTLSPGKNWEPLDKNLELPKEQAMRTSYVLVLPKDIPEYSLLANDLLLVRIPPYKAIPDLMFVWDRRSNQKKLVRAKTPPPEYIGCVLSIIRKI